MPVSSVALFFMVDSRTSPTVSARDDSLVMPEETSQPRRDRKPAVLSVFFNFCMDYSSVTFLI